MDGGGVGQPPGHADGPQLAGEGGDAIGADHAGAPLQGVGEAAGGGGAPGGEGTAERLDRRPRPADEERQFARPQGLAEVVIHSGRQATFAVARQRVGGHRDDRRVAGGALSAADLGGRSVPVEVRLWRSIDTRPNSPPRAPFRPPRRRLAARAGVARPRSPSSASALCALSLKGDSPAGAAALRWRGTGRARPGAARRSRSRPSRRRPGRGSRPSRRCPDAPRGCPRRSA